MIQVTFRSGIDLPSKLSRILITQCSNIHRYIHAHLYDTCSNDLVWKLDVLNKLVGNLNQCLFWPVREPVQRGAVYQRGEFPASNPQGLPNWTHAQDDMQVLPNAVDK